jgi:hypothetical protein
MALYIGDGHSRGEYDQTHQQDFHTLSDSL